MNELELNPLGDEDEVSIELTFCCVPVRGKILVIFSHASIC